jgi:hypothetical protein
MIRSSMLSIPLVKSGERDAIRADNVESRDLTRVPEWQKTATAEKDAEHNHHRFPRDISCSSDHLDLVLILLSLLLQS